MIRTRKLYGKDGTLYLTRYRLGPLGLHVFERGDVDPEMHDHPWDFWTFPLTSYVEMFLRPADGNAAFRVVKAFRLHRRPAEFTHRVFGRWAGYKMRVDSRRIVTLLWFRPKRREWGFYATKGWVDWRTHLGITDAE